MLNSIVGLAVLMAAGLLLGWRWHGSLAAALAAVGLLLLLRFSLLWMGIFFGLVAKVLSQSLRCKFWYGRSVFSPTSSLTQPPCRPGWEPLLYGIRSRDHHGNP